MTSLSRAAAMLLLVTAVAAITVAPATGQPRDDGSKKAAKKVLVHFGQDMPWPTVMIQHAAKFDESPFGGVVFRVPTKEKPEKDDYLNKQAFGSTPISWDSLAPQLEAAKKLKLTRTVNNFLRVNLEPGNVDWFDDDGWKVILENQRLVARFAKQTNYCIGLVVDTEAYAGRVLTYVTRPLAKEKTLEQYSAKVKERAAAMMKVWQEEFPGLIIFITHGYEKTIVNESPTTKVGKLLPPFLDGILSAAAKDVVFVEGYEKSYAFKDEKEFVAGRKEMLETNPKRSSEPKAYQARLSVGFAVTPDWPHEKGEFFVNPKDFAKNYFSPEAFQKSTTYALTHADRFVWVYGQKNAAWFPPKPETMPKEYRDSLWGALKATGNDK